MDIYLIVLVLIIFFGMFAEFNQDRKNKQNYLILIFILFASVATFRADTVGSDTQTYLNALHGIRNERFELGYYYFNESLISFGVSDMWFFFIVATIIYVPILISFYTYSQSALISVMFFYCMQFFGLSLSATRQMIALAIVSLGIKYISQSKPYKWLIICAVASMFHYSALCMCPLCLSIRNINYKLCWFVFLILEFVLFALSDVVVQFIPQLLWFRPDYIVYLSVKPLTGLIGDYIVLFVANGLIFLCTFCIQNRNSNVIRLSLYALMGFCFVLIISFSTGNIFKRFNIYYSFFLMYLIPWIVYSIKDMGYRLICTWMICMSLLFYYLYRMPSLAPYTTSF